MTAVLPEFWQALVIASETATKHPRDWFQIFLKILFMCFFS